MESTSQVPSRFYTDTTNKPFSCTVKHIPIKRIFDITFSAIALTLFFPFLIMIMLLIKFSSQGKVFYSHERVGRGGKNFACVKFRTMYPDADARLEMLLKNDPELQKEWARSYKLKNDPRVTPIGKFLRRTSLDEFPQFWNVLKGDLSVVGPRPVLQEEIDRYFKANAHKVLSVRPGLTGIWQVSGRSNTSYKTRIQMDEYYVDNRNFLLDLKLVLKTVPCMILSRGAY